MDWKALEPSEAFFEDLRWPGASRPSASCFHAMVLNASPRPTARRTASKWRTFSALIG